MFGCWLIQPESEPKPITIQAVQAAPPPDPRIAVIERQQRVILNMFEHIKDLQAYPTLTRRKAEYDAANDSVRN